MADSTFRRVSYSYVVELSAFSPYISVIGPTVSLQAQLRPAGDQNWLSLFGVRIGYAGHCTSSLSDELAVSLGL